MVKEDQDRLRKMLGGMIGQPGISAQWVMKERWERLCWVADYYAQPLVLETWKDAEAQWKAVETAARKLHGSLEALGILACAARLDAALAAPSVWLAVRNEIPGAPGADFYSRPKDIEEFAKQAKNVCAERKEAHNGAKRRDDSGARTVLVQNLVDLLEVPARPKSHAQRIAEVIRVWAQRATGTEINAMKRTMAKGEKLRFGEHALKRASSKLKQ